jgi:hypothetical protein
MVMLMAGYMAMSNALDVTSSGFHVTSAACWSADATDDVAK